MDSHWQQQLRRLQAIATEHRKGEPLPEIVAGLPTVLTETDFYELCSAYVERVVARCIEAKPTASLVVEKTPRHVQYVPLIERLTGGTARYIHVIRHGYEVVDSLLTASRDWGARWAPSDPATAAALWRDDVRKGRKTSELGERYTEVRFERLKHNYSEVLDELSAFLGVDVSSAPRNADGTVVLGEVAEAFNDGVLEPPGFQRGKGTPDAMAVYATERIAGDLLDELGYQRQSINGVRGARLATAFFVKRNYGRARRLRRVIQQSQLMADLRASSIKDLRAKSA